MVRKIHIDLGKDERGRDKLLPHQRKLLLSKSKKSALICGRGAGKSFACAVIVLLTLIKGRNVLVGGQRYDTIHDTLYEEIKKLATEWEIFDIIEWRERPMMMTLGEAHVWFGTYESVDAVRGYSKVSLIILDEMFLAPANILSIWGPCQRATDDGKTRIIGATTPRAGSLWNVTMSSDKCDWEIIRAATMDNDRIKEEEYNLILSGIDNEVMYRQEILGEISTDLGGAAIIHLEDFPDASGPTTDERVIAGLDVSEGVERDATAFVVRKGNKVLEMWKLNTIDHETTIRLVRDAHKRFHITKLNIDAAFSDHEFNVLKYEIPCEQVNFARAAIDNQKYGNVRAEMFFNLATTIKRGLCCDGFELTAELKRQMCAITWHHNNQGRLLLVKKEELREVLKQSTDVADALALTCLDRWHGDDPVMRSKDSATISKEDEAEIMADV